jgi:hypothetical protein
LIHREIAIVFFHTPNVMLYLRSKLFMQELLCRRAVLFSVALLVALQASCARVATNPKAVRPTTSELILPQALPGEKTQGCDHVLRVLHALQAYTSGQSTQRVAFEFTEAEINEYLAYSLRIKPRVGVKGLAVRFFPDNEISVLAAIDFAGVQKWNDWLIPATMRPALLDGQRPVQVDIKFQAADGSGSFKLKDVIGPGNAVIPKAAMEWIIRAIALHQPEWYDTTSDISLPFSLQRIWTATQSLFGAT